MSGLSGTPVGPAAACPGSAVSPPQTGKPVPESALASLSPRGQASEMTRLKDYEAHL